jgi:protein-S-isoprenylcysteine O-methyltransferase Ste14
MPLKMSIPFFVYVLLLVARNAVEIKLKPHSFEKTPKIKPGGISLLIFIGSYMGSAFVVAKLLQESDDTNYPLFILGAFVMILAFMGRVSTVREMGKSYDQFIAPKSEGNLVTTGAFSLIRHPLYMLYTLEMSAFMLIKFNLVSLLFFWMVLSTSVFRAIKEEKLLEQKFGKAYGDYCRKTKMFIPFIY